MLTIALVGCAKTKSITHPSGYEAAQDIYTSDLFKKRRAHVESRRLPWYILSAKAALLKPRTPIRDYDASVADLNKIQKAQWTLDCANGLLLEVECEFGINNPSEVTIELHAGKEYCEPLETVLKLMGFKVVRPVAGLGIGEQLAYYTIPQTAKSM